MARIIRLTESELTRLVRRVINENEKSKSCPIVVNKLLNKIENSLTSEELELIISEYERLGQSGFEHEVISTLENEKITEGRRNTKLENTISKIAQIVAISSVGFLGGSTLVLSCLEDMVNPPNLPDWAVVAYGGAMIASIPLALISVIAMAMTMEDK